MTLFQFALIAGIIVAAIFAIRVVPGERSLAIKRIFALLLVVAAILAILFPGALTVVANTFGIGRGTDLLLYVFIVMALLFAVAIVRAKARSDARVTDLARAVALIEARNVERVTPTQDEKNGDTA
ncbi:MAG: DUF2304 domain-containing protein [Leucobacter sp.]